MFIHEKSGRPAFLISQDETGVTYDDGGKRHCIPSHEFFTAYREATADDLAATRPAPAKAKAKAAEPAKAKAARAARKPKGGDSAPAAQSQPVQQPQASTAAPGAPRPTVRVETI